MIRRRRDVPDHGWTTAVSSGFALAGFLSLVFVAFTLLAMDPFIRYDAYFNLAPPPREWVPALHVLDRVGQRAVALPILGAVVWWIYHRTRDLRPVLLAAASVFALNLVVLLLKLGLGRAAPGTADPSFFAGGMAYPSGHSANIVLVYGLATYLVGAYLRPSTRALTAMWSGVALLAVTMVVTSLTLNWHWFADLVAGLIVGGVVLELSVTIDRMVPASAVASGTRGVRAVLGRLLVRRPQGPTGSA